jgi:hypothetical protein
LGTIAWKGCLGCLLNGALSWISGYTLPSVVSPSHESENTHRVDLDLSNRSVTRRSDNLHDLDQLIRVISASEEGVSRDHLREASIIS